MRIPTLIFAAASLTFAVAAVAQSQTSTPPPPGDMPGMSPEVMRNMTPEQMRAMHARHEAMMHGPVIAARQAGFKLQLAAFLSVKAGLTRGDDVKTMVLPASAIAGWGKAIPAMFPPGTDTPESAALPSIWSDRAGFEAAAATLTADATKLADLAKAGDTAGVAAQWTVLKGACDDCHTKYRKPPEKK